MKFYLYKIVDKCTQYICLILQNIIEAHTLDTHILAH